jgi:hypothetical protein
VQAGAFLRARLGEHDRRVVEVEGGEADFFWDRLAARVLAQPARDHQVNDQE